VRADLKTGIIEGHACRRRGHLRQPVHAPQGCGTDEILWGEVSDLSSQFGIEAGGVEKGDGSNAAKAAEEMSRENLFAHAQRCHQAHTGHDDSSMHGGRLNR
jgi:hypothetical protein